ncbi:uncharacterized protein [Rutidosis leptorrhynchoides]|uniref:uncharacterized protein n=1 Tax=Rutidosis leptorrhynchoides TaxID=125765 RepID=UPI003A9902DE
MRPWMEDLRYPSILVEEAGALERPILENEIHDAILDCGSTKAPGPHGFNMRFFKKFWDIIKIELVDAISWLWDKGVISRSCNASFVTLIPKKSNPEGLGDFRPINLIRSYYKIVAKILSNCLRKILSSLVSSEQSAFLKGVDYSVVSSMARYIGCQVGKFPFIYLGLPIGAKMNKVKYWQSVIDKFNSRLSSLKMRSMSSGGGLVLIKSVLTSLPLYYFLIFRAPPSVIKLLESVKIIRSIYGSNGGLLVEGDNNHSSPIGIWGNIIVAGVAMDELHVAFAHSFTKTIGDGDSTLFWLQHWIGSDKLCNLFSRLYMLEINQNASVKDRCCKRDGELISSWNWSRIPSGRTATELGSLVNLLSSFEGNCNCNNSDTWRWAFASSGVFTLKQLNAILDEQILGQYTSQ